MKVGAPRRSRDCAVRVDLSALRDYARAVYAETDAFLASLDDDALGQSLDLSGVGLGQQTVASALTLLVPNHIGTETGEIACLKGLQGARGYRSKLTRR